MINLTTLQYGKTKYLFRPAHCGKFTHHWYNKRFRLPTTCSTVYHWLVLLPLLLDYSTQKNHMLNAAQGSRSLGTEECCFLKKFYFLLIEFSLWYTLLTNDYETTFWSDIINIRKHLWPNWSLYSSRSDWKWLVNRLIRTEVNIFSWTKNANQERARPPRCRMDEPESRLPMTKAACCLLDWGKYQQV